MAPDADDLMDRRRRAGVKPSAGDSFDRLVNTLGIGSWDEIMTKFILRAFSNATFRLTRDLSQWATAYSLAEATIRMQARTSPFSSDPPAYEWVTGASAGGKISFDPATNLAVIAAPESDMAALGSASPYCYDCRLETADGGSNILFSGQLYFSAGVTRTSGDSAATTVPGACDTVSVDGEILSTPVPLPLALSAAVSAAQAAAAIAQAAAANSPQPSALIYALLFG